MSKNLIVIPFIMFVSLGASTRNEVVNDTFLPEAKVSTVHVDLVLSPEYTRDIILELKYNKERLEELKSKVK